MGQAESKPGPEPEPPKQLHEMTLQELQAELLKVKNTIQQVVEHAEMLHDECIKGERLLAVMRLAHVKKEAHTVI